MEPPEKLLKTDENEIKAMIVNMQCSFINKLKSIEEKIEGLNTKYHCLEEKVENILLKVKETSTKVTCSSNSSESSLQQYISPNSEDAYPNGSWLGNPYLADQRVRSNISPVDLENLNNTCTTAEKMALTLLDYLFDRETQARSNISGTGKHGKKQLDPLKIYGIKCHIVHMFNTSNKEWLRIRQNLDSKCRTAFRRKQKGLSLKVKGSKDRSSNTIHRVPPQFNGDSPCDTSFLESSDYQNLLLQKSESQHLVFDSDIGPVLPFKLEPENCSLPFSDDVAQIIHTEHGDIQVIQATEEQLEQLKNTHHVEILSQTDMLPETILS